MIDHCSQKEETSSSRAELCMIGFQKTETAVGHDSLHLGDIRKQEASVCVMTEQEM